MKATQMLNKLATELVQSKEELEATAQLNAEGYFQQQCKKCAGAGYIRIPFIFSFLPIDCTACGGDGISWEKKTV